MLGRLLLENPALLMLDEPTNHLDITSVNILIQAMQQYEGTFVTVSHNRHFINEVANKIWYIEDQEIKEYPGTYEEFEFWRKEKLEKEKQEAVQPDTKANKSQKQEKTGEKKKSSNNSINKENKKALTKAKNKLQKIEEEITRLEKDKENIENELSDPQIHEKPEELKEKNQSYQEINQSLEEKNKLWEDYVEEIENLEEK